MRLPILALALLIVGNTSAPTPQSNAKAEQPHGAQASSNELKRIASAIEALPKAQAPDGGCPDGKENRGSDLCAQWKAADAATDSATWTLYTFIAGLIGLGIGTGTLYAAIRAAIYARDAAKAARDTLDHERDIHRLQFEAVLTLSILPVLEGDSVKYLIAVANDGTRSTADNVEIQCDVTLKVAESTINSVVAEEQFGEVGPGARKTHTLNSGLEGKFSDYLPLGEVRDIVRRRLPPWPVEVPICVLAAGSLNYRTRFGHAVTLGFEATAAFVCHAHVNFGGEEISLVPAEEKINLTREPIR